MTQRFWIVWTFLAVAFQAFGGSQDVTGDGWSNISDAVVSTLTRSGAKIPWPGNTGGIAVDRATGEVFLEVCNVGLWKSSDHGQTFNRVAEGKISGRCEFGYAFNCDPAGGRMACFFLDGKCGMTLDGGKSWQSFAPMGRNWDYGAVDWSDPQARAIFAARHESGGEMYVSGDAGASWNFIGKHPEFTAVAIFDSMTLAAGRADGIVRSTDGGKSWTKISDFHPVGRVAVYFKGLTYWLAKEGLVTSADKGATWQQQGAGVDAGWGPFFGTNAQQIMVADAQGFLRTLDGGKTWERVASMAPFQGGLTPKQPGQFIAAAWDPHANILYASRMGSAAYRLPLFTPDIITPTQKIRLFDGKSLAGWTFVPMDTTQPAAAIWSVTNGVIFCQGKPNGYARTLKFYRDYQLHVEWRWPAGPGNSGVFVHLNPPDKVWPYCFEAQLLSGSAGELRLNGGSEIARLAHSNVISVPRQKADSEKPCGEWNSCDIVCRGNTITLRINGVLQNEITGTSAESGAIGLQAEGSPVEFRNIILDKLPDDK